MKKDYKPWKGFTVKYVEYIGEMLFPEASKELKEHNELNR
jgi:hypothetical protein